MTLNQVLKGGVAVQEISSWDITSVQSLKHLLSLYNRHTGWVTLKFWFYYGDFECCDFEIILQDYESAYIIKVNDREIDLEYDKNVDRFVEALDTWIQQNLHDGKSNKEEERGDS